MKAFLAVLLKFLTGIVVTFGIWAVFVAVLKPPSFMLPGPVEVLLAFPEHAGFLLHHASITAYETVLGFALGVLSGALLAISVWLFPLAGRVIMPPVLVTQALPVFAIAPVLVLWLGFGMSSKIVMAILVIFFTVTSTVYDGLRRLDTGLVDLARLYRVPRHRELWVFRIPAALPAFASGLRVAAVFAPMGAVIGEWAGAKGGLAFIMLQANARGNSDMLFAAVILLALMVLAMRYAVEQLTRILVPWQVED
ncbi:ABC transporter permease [Roseibium marinum]|uniref:Putative hydroxymethylpyrimidine transport system permease protein n=1 Tax=Roseibium marinum TaxID=281252 RepID=A0A2S3UL55_9HYPH|nr:ABC transporter permease [Roseibium marinum]POF28447.1 putative hydroxymethylpyrimidine transport system permease protein [Roseibium marinum]